MSLAEHIRDNTHTLRIALMAQGIADAAERLIGHCAVEEQPDLIVQEGVADEHKH